MEAIDIFRIIAPEFADIPDDDVRNDEGKVTQYGVSTYLELNKDLISEKKFGKLYNRALALLTAHKLKLRGYGNSGVSMSAGNAIGISSVSEGKVSVSFGNSQQGNLLTDGELALTVYGIEYLNLRRSCIMTIVSAGEGHGYGR